MSRTSQILILVLVGALAIRLAYVLQLPTMDLLSIDGHEYRDIALNLAEGRGFASSNYRWFEPQSPGSPDLHPDLFRPPLLPLIGAGLARLPGEWTSWARLTAALLGTLLVLSLYWLGCELFSRRVGVLAAALLAVYPYAIFYSARWSTETLYALCLICACAALSRDRARWMGISGAILGLAVLARPNGLLQAAGLFVGALLLRQRPRRAKAALLFLVALLMVLSPWMLRNHQLTGIPNPGTCFGPYNMWLGANPRMYAMYRAGEQSRFATAMQALYSEDSREHVERMAAMGLFSESEMRCYWHTQVKRFVQDHPKELFEILLYRSMHFLRLWPNRATSAPYHFWISLLTLGPLSLLALHALLRLRPARHVLVAWPLILAWLGSLPFVFHLRFRFPVYDPLLILLAATSLVELARKSGHHGD